MGIERVPGRVLTCAARQARHGRSSSAHAIAAARASENARSLHLQRGQSRFWGIVLMALVDSEGPAESGTSRFQQVAALPAVSPPRRSPAPTSLFPAGLSHKP